MGLLPLQLQPGSALVALPDALVPADEEDAALFKTRRQVFARLGLNQHLLEEGREVTLVDPSDFKVLLVLPMHSGPVGLQGPKHSHIQQLQLVCAVSREAHELDVFIPASLYHRR